MAQARNSTHIWLMRFRLNADRFQEQQVYLLNYPDLATKQLEESVRIELGVDRLWFNQRLQTSDLSRAIRSLSLSPYLISAYDYRIAAPRHLIVLSKDNKHASEVLPPYILRRIFHVWVESWLNQNFEKDLSESTRTTLLNEFLSQIDV